jgi:putative tricarboxylic transport membrane protein
MRTQRTADIVSGCFLACLGLVVLFAATKITGGMEERLPPRTLPYFLGATLLVSSIILVFKSWGFRGENPDIKWPDRKGMLHVIVTIVSLAVYVALIDPIGMPIATALFVAFLVWYLWHGRHRVVYAVVTGLASGAVVMYLFMRFLELNFPMGILELLGA